MQQTGTVTQQSLVGAEKNESVADRTIENSYCIQTSTHSWCDSMPTTPTKANNCQAYRIYTVVRYQDNTVRITIYRKTLTPLIEGEQRSNCPRYIAVRNYQRTYDLWSAWRSSQAKPVVLKRAKLSIRKLTQAPNKREGALFYTIETRHRPVHTPTKRPNASRTPKKQPTYLQL